MSPCPYSGWTVLPIELRRHLRSVSLHLVGVCPPVDLKGKPPPRQPDEVLALRVAHLADTPRCRTCRTGTA